MKSGSCHPACMTTKIIVTVLLFVTSVAALVGVYQTHFIGGSLQFGSTAGSLAILAFVASVVTFTKKLMHCMMPCEVCSMK